MSNFSIKKPSAGTTTALSKPPTVAQKNKTNAKKSETAPKQRSSSGVRKNHKSIFSRIASSFKALSFKAIKERNRNRAQTRMISKEIKSNMNKLKINMPYELQTMSENMGMGRYGMASSYIVSFSSLKKTFTDEVGKKTLAESVISDAGKYEEVIASRISRHLTTFCDFNNDQAILLSTLLTSGTVSTIDKQLKENSLTLNARTKPKDVAMDVHMMKDKTARIVIQQQYEGTGARHATIVKTTIDVPRQLSAESIVIGIPITRPEHESIILSGVKITSATI